MRNAIPASAPGSHRSDMVPFAKSCRFERIERTDVYAIVDDVLPLITEVV